MSYHRTVELDPSRRYHFVDMGPLDKFNGPSNYPFPTEDAATRFAKAHKQIARDRGIDRDVAVVYPDGRKLATN